MIPAGFLTIPASSCSHDLSLRMVEYHSTPPMARSFRLLSSSSSHRFLPHAVPPSSCLSTPFTTPGLFQTLRLTSTLFSVYALWVSDLHLPSRFITRSEMSHPTGSTASPPIPNGCNTISSGMRRDFVTTSLTDRRARPYLTTTTELPNRHEARGA